MKYIIINMIVFSMKSLSINCAARYRIVGIYYTVGLAIPDIVEKRPHEYVHVRVHSLILLWLVGLFE